MNKYERLFFEDEIRESPKYAKWYFEGIRFVLAEHRCTYTPDFFCINRLGEAIAYEVKGFWRDDARVKIKVAARLHPWVRFIAVTKNKKKDWPARGRWNYEEL